MQQLYEIAAQAREQRLEGNHNDSGSPFPLDGYCFDNSFVVYHLLKKNGFDPRFMVGLAEEYAEPLLRETKLESINTVEDLAGYTHYWVECDGYVIDIAPVEEGLRGSPYIDRSLPDTYHRLSDSETVGEETLRDAKHRRCTYCGGKSGWCGCPVE